MSKRQTKLLNIRLVRSDLGLEEEPFLTKMDMTFSLTLIMYHGYTRPESLPEHVLTGLSDMDLGTNS